MRSGAPLTAKPPLNVVAMPRHPGHVLQRGFPPFHGNLRCLHGFYAASGCDPDAECTGQWTGSGVQVPPDLPRLWLPNLEESINQCLCQQRVHLPKPIEWNVEFEFCPICSDALTHKGSVNAGVSRHHRPVHTCCHQHLRARHTSLSGILNEIHSQLVPSGIGDDAGRCVDPLIAAVLGHGQNGPSGLVGNKVVSHPSAPPGLQTQVDDALGQQIIDALGWKSAMSDQRLTHHFEFQVSLLFFSRVLKITTTAHAGYGTHG